MITFHFRRAVSWTDGSTRVVHFYYMLYNYGTVVLARCYAAQVHTRETRQLPTFPSIP